MAFELQQPPAKRRYIPKKVKHEESLQRQACGYLRVHFPHVIFRSDYGSGMQLPINQARIQRSLQSSRAWPDLFLYAPARGYHGLAIELKKEGTAIVVTRGPRKGHFVSNPHIQEQALMLKALNNLGYSAHFACGLDEFIKLVNWYFDYHPAEALQLL